MFIIQCVCQSLTDNVSNIFNANLLTYLRQQGRHYRPSLAELNLYSGSAHWAGLLNVWGGGLFCVTRGNELKTKTCSLNTELTQEWLSQASTDHEESEQHLLNRWSRPYLGPRHHLPSPLQPLHIVDLVHLYLKRLLQGAAQRRQVHPLTPHLPAQRGGVREGSGDQTAPLETWWETMNKGAVHSNSKSSHRVFSPADCQCVYMHLVRLQS